MSSLEGVVSRRRRFRYFARFQGRFLVMYRLYINENLIRSSFEGGTAILNVSAS